MLQHRYKPQYKETSTKDKLNLYIKKKKKNLQEMPYRT